MIGEMHEARTSALFHSEGIMPRVSASRQSLSNVRGAWLDYVEEETHARLELISLFL